MQDALRRAMTDAGMTADRLARTVDVTVRTVERWLADPDRAPHPETRERVAEVLGVSVESLWPGVRGTLKLGHDRELVAMYPFRSMCPASVWGELLDGARDRIVMAGYTNYFLWQDQPRVIERLRAKAAAGCEIRFLLGDPDSQLTRDREELEQVPLTVSTRIQITLDQLARMGPTRGLEARFSDSPAHLSQSVFVFDDDLLFTPHIGDGLGHESPLFHLRRQRDDGVFDRFATHVEVLWGRGRPVPAVGGSS